MARYEHEGDYRKQPSPEVPKKDDRALRDLRHIRHDIETIKRLVGGGIILALVIYFGPMIYRLF